MKTETKQTHTPGPWTCNKKAQVSLKDTMFSHCAVIHGGIKVADAVGVGNENAEANARLIAAAPELLEACRKASAMVNYYRRAVMTGLIVGTHSQALVQGDYEVMDSLDKAIAKAESRASEGE